MYGSRQKLWDMTYLYKEIEDFAKIFNVEDRGQAVIADFKKREADLRKEFGKNKRDLSFVFGSPAHPRLLMLMSAVKTVLPDLLPTFWVGITPSPPRPNGRR
jgi:ABC-type Fe3+-hydroxamate transport system substrate-binding protein